MAVNGLKFQAPTREASSTFHRRGEHFFSRIRLLNRDNTANHIKFGGPIRKNLLRKCMNKLVDPNFISCRKLDFLKFGKFLVKDHMILN